ncbi:hypothetical protein H0H92_012710, partial [Tricholoma furcatifolium]
MNSFVDPKIEAFYASGAANSVDSRTSSAHKTYIAERIEAHQAIIRYYKRHLNALTITCRVPPEVLACIFTKIIENVVVTNHKWIRQISHVCVYWRRVALSTPRLWSTVVLGSGKDRALAMLHRSKESPLSVMLPKIWLSEDQYLVVKEALTLHLSRIRDLSLHTRCRAQDSRELLESLDSHDPLKIERLTMGTEYPPHVAPSQILRFLSQTPLLERLSVYDIDADQEGLPLDNVELIHLKFASVSCGIHNPGILPPFFQHLVFPKSNFELHTWQPEGTDYDLFALPNWLEEIDDALDDGLPLATSRLQWLSSKKLICWKRNETQEDSDSESMIPLNPWTWTSADGREFYAPTSIAHGFLITKSQPYYYMDAYAASALPSTKVTFQFRDHTPLNEGILQSLRLDQLVALTVESACLDISFWDFAGKLPRLESLEADVPYAYPTKWRHLDALFDALHSTGGPRSFLALVSLTFSRIELGRRRRRKAMPVDALCDILEVRSVDPDLSGLQWLGFVDASFKEDIDLRLYRLEQFAYESNFHLST